MMNFDPWEIRGREQMDKAHPTAVAPRHASGEGSCAREQACHQPAQTLLEVNTPK